MQPIDAPRYLLPALPHAVSHRYPVVVVGAGAAGLAAALSAANHGPVAVLVRTILPESNSAWAQGGIAAALDATDAPALHVADTLIAGAGLSDREAVETLAAEAPALMRELAAGGVPFDRTADAELALGLEGGHSRRRIVHAGDATGWAVTRTLIEAARNHPQITLFEGLQVVDLLGEGRISGVLARDSAGIFHRFRAGATVLATGGAGALYGLTSNQAIALGEGIAMAYRAGAEIADMEFVQFHPTVMRTRSGRGFLISEAARGEGAILRDTSGQRFMPSYDERGELAPRDVVTRGIYAAMQRTGSDHVWLDLSHLDAETLAHHFPTISARCREEGIEISREPIPVAPAAHYLMGGVRTDLEGRTSLPGLFAAGEVTCTGVHGANRLASNSLLECLVFGRRAGEYAGQAARGTPVERGSAPAQPQASDDDATWREELATIMREHVGPLRAGASLATGLQRLAAFDLRASSAAPEAITAANAALCARLITSAALFREESRGGHFRHDFPFSRPEWQAHFVWQRHQPARAVSSLAGEELHAAAAD